MFGSKGKTRQKQADAIMKALGSPPWLESVSVDETGRAVLVIEADPADTAAAEALRMDAEGKAGLVPGIKTVSTVLTAERKQGAAPAHTHNHAPAGSKGRTELLNLTPSPRRVQKGARLSDEAMQQGAPQRQQGSVAKIPGISRILVVASAKGGVGKSTVSVNLAAALAKTGMKVGLLDADIYGPSIPTMLGTQGAEPKGSANKKLVPVEAHGMKTLSIGYLSDPDAPMIWRGPIVMSAITQMLNDAEWGTPEDPLDVLVIDTPPGTGDAQLTIAQKVPVTAALIVTTPQEVALADVRRGAAMFTKTAVPVIGIVETMSYFQDPAGNKHYLMGHGGGKRMADALGLPLLAEVPMLQAIREGGDTGVPAAIGDEETAKAFHELARKVAIGLDTLETKAPPEIVFED
ncbi:Mrp/NBP35 family ATP-binding protein [Hyphomonas jannaschiana]|uniref:Mrp/NBP35 family ATP-binding protein n=1 Tax=Hyphomonas jannaschiana TaxID=86 RepID=UPI0035C6AC22